MVRDDRILPETHIISGLLVPILFAGSVILYVFPGRTEQLFAWTIRPDMTPMVMGAGYASGVYFFSRLFLGKRWHYFGRTLPGVAAFAAAMLLVTPLHWDRFNHDHISFIAWFAIYLITPFVVVGLWWRNRATDPGTPDADDVVVPQGIRLAAAVIGGAVTLAGLAIFIQSDLAIDRAPWTLSPLTARVLAGWMIFPGVISLGLAPDTRWSAWRVGLQGTMVWAGLLALAIPRAWDDFHGGTSRTLFVTTVATWLIATIAVYVVLESRRGRSDAIAVDAAPVTDE